MRCYNYGPWAMAIGHGGGGGGFSNFNGLPLALALASGERALQHSIMQNAGRCSTDSTTARCAV